MGSARGRRCVVLHKMVHQNLRLLDRCRCQRRAGQHRDEGSAENVQATVGMKQKRAVPSRHIVEADGPEVARAYQLLADTWLQLNEMPEHSHFTYQACDFHDLPAAEENGWLSNEDWNRISTDPFYMVGTWRLMLTYFLTDYRYIFE